MLWAALLLASSSPTIDPSASAPPVPPVPLEIVTPARTFQVDVGRASVTVTVDVDGVARPTRVPVRVQARLREHISPMQDEAPLMLSVCDDLRCTLRSDVAIPIDNEPVTVVASLFPSGLALTMRHLDDQSRCCNMSTLGRNTPVIATTSPVGPHVDVTHESAGGLVVVPTGETLLRRPSLLESFDALIVEDEGWFIGGMPDPHDAALQEFVKRGGIASLPVTFFGARDDATGLVPNEALFTVTIAGVPNQALPVRPFTTVVRSGNGAFVIRPVGATREEQLGGLLAVRPDLLLWSPPYGQGESVAQRAAGAGLATRPHRGLAFLIAFLCVAGAALCVRTSRRRGWRMALASSAIVAVAGASLFWMFEQVTVPRETRTRVVAWLGPNAQWEVGVDAVRPRATAEVTVAAPVMPVVATVLGEDVPPREPTRSTGVDANGSVEWRVTSTVGSSSALLVAWERAAHPHARPPVERKNDVVTNNLDVPLRAVSLHHGGLVTGAIEPHASRKVAEFEQMARYDAAHLDLTEMEQRLLTEIRQACIARVRPADIHSHEVCGAAIAVLDDGTLLGIEVSQ